MIELWKILPEAQVGEFKISHFTINESHIATLSLKDVCNNRNEYSSLEPGTFVRLSRNGSTIMSNTPMEYHTNSEFIQKAHGDVLIAGLGIGLVILAIQDNQRIKSLTIVEKFQEVIDLVYSHLPVKKECNIVCADIYNYNPEKKFNTIYFDIWNDINYDIQNIEILGEKFIEYLDVSDPDCYMGFWREEDAINYSLETAIKYYNSW